MLAEANAEVEKLSAEAYKPPLEKCLIAFEECDEAQKEEALLQHLMPHSAAASCMVGHQTVEVADAMGHLLSMLPQDEFARTRLGSRDVLVVCVGSLDIALAPSLAGVAARRLLHTFQVGRVSRVVVCQLLVSEHDDVGAHGIQKRPVVRDTDRDEL